MEVLRGRGQGSRDGEGYGPVRVRRGGERRRYLPSCGGGEERLNAGRKLAAAGRGDEVPLTVLPPE